MDDIDKDPEGDDIYIVHYDEYVNETVNEVMKVNEVNTTYFFI